MVLLVEQLRKGFIYIIGCHPASRPTLSIRSRDRRTLLKSASICPFACSRTAAHGVTQADTEKLHNRHSESLLFL